MDQGKRPTDGPQVTLPLRRQFLGLKFGEVEGL
jgi:hypothetical protein